MDTLIGFIQFVSLNVEIIYYQLQMIKQLSFGKFNLEKCLNNLQNIKKECFKLEYHMMVYYFVLVAMINTLFYGALIAGI